MADDRRVRLWGMVAAQAGARGAAVSAGDACEVAAAVAGVDGAWLSVMSDPARRTLVHATDQRAADLDELQFTVGEGPGTDAFRLGSPVLAADLESVAWRLRWPGFALALAGVAAVFAFPLVMGAIRVGVLGLYRKTPGPLGLDELADVLVCADTALLLLLNSRAGTDGGGTDGRGTAGGMSMPRCTRRQAWCPRSGALNWKRRWRCCGRTRSPTTSRSMRSRRRWWPGGCGWIPAKPTSQPSEDGRA